MDAQSSMIYFGNKCIAVTNDTQDSSDRTPLTTRGAPFWTSRKSHCQATERRTGSRVLRDIFLYKVAEASRNRPPSSIWRLFQWVSGLDPFRDEGITMRELAKQVESSVEEETLELSLENAFKEFYKLGAEHYDLNLGNFLFCANGQVVVIDLEDIEFHDRQQAWELSRSMGCVYYLMSRFRDVRYPGRPPSPVLYSEMPVALGCTGHMSCSGSLRKSRFEQ